MRGVQRKVQSWNNALCYLVYEIILIFGIFKGKKHVKDLPAKLSKEAEISMDLIQYKLSNTVLDTRQYL